MTYNGWYNYETWLTNLHFNSFFEFFKEAVDDGVFEDMDEQDVQNYIAEFIEQYVRDYVDETVGQNSLFIMDMIGSFLDDVDWVDLAEHYVVDVMEAIAEKNNND